MTPPAHQKETLLTTARGDVRVISFCTPAQIEAFSLPQASTRYPRYNPIISKKSSLAAAAAASDDANVTVAVNEARQIVGFGILEYPREGERWLRVGPQVMMEVAVVEVSRDWRRERLAGIVLGHLMDHPRLAERIFYMVGYSWTWDLEGAGVTAIDYRSLMISLFARHGFQVYQTNEANVMLRPENLFMAAVGDRVPEAVRKRFKLVLFNLDL